MYKTLDTKVILAQIKEVGRIFLADFRQNQIPQSHQDLMNGLKLIEECSLNELRQRIDPILPGTPWVDDDEFDGPAQTKPADYQQYWLCDTMDGAIQYLQHIAGWTINLVLIRDGQPIFSAIYDPFQDELFWAVKGGGSFLNNVKLQVSKKHETSNMVAVLEYGHQLKTDSSWKAKMEAAFSKLLSRFGVVRNYGPHGLQIAYVGAGRIDLFLQEDLDTHNWLAGLLIAEEAGAVIRSSNGGDWKWGNENLLAGTPEAVNIFLTEKPENI
ncbi:inositol monophosphatase family protein [Dyadobacter crusticola]|uniref:inositol monophosphatase family protein n=1 Tax=Dyadobacter crusticola TaxID=292407 RepID=UPI0004E0BFD6|nr:inositol monophosphatase family protein [Dyadobacter crusticola]